MEHLVDQVLYNLVLEFSKGLSFYDLTVLPGTRDGLSLLEKEDFLLGLVTGNCEKIAELKLSKAELWQYFRFGGFGEHSRDRSDLVVDALEKARNFYGFSDLQRTFLVGDTPSDIKAGLKGGVRTFGLSTGIFKREELLDAGAENVFGEMSDITEHLLRIV